MRYYLFANKVVVSIAEVEIKQMRAFLFVQNTHGQTKHYRQFYLFKQSFPPPRLLPYARTLII